MAKRQNNRINKKVKSKSTEEIQENMESSFFSPGATNIYVAGEFNGWGTQSLPMKRDEDGIWRSKVKLLPGRYEYKLPVDNAWVEDFPDSESVFNPFSTKKLRHFG